MFSIYSKILLVLLFVQTLFGQENSSILFQLGGSNSAVSFQFGSENQVFICQIGDKNTNNVDQNGIGNFLYYSDIGRENDVTGFQFASAEETRFFKSGSNYDNYSLVSQDGRMNAATIVNSGALNSLSLLQKGKNNQYTCQNTGNNNLNGIEQYGDNNFIQQRINASNADFSILQDGDFNSVYHLDYSMVGIDISIIQHGDWMKTMIVNGVITQKKKIMARLNLY